MEIIKKLAIVALFWFTSLASFAQGVLSLPEMNMLYRGYNNVIQVGTGNYRKPVVLSGVNVSITHSDSDTLTYFARINGSGREATIFVLSENLKDTLATYKYRVRNLPPPDLFYGTTPSGGIIETIDDTLRCTFSIDLFAPTKVEFTVLNYELIIEGTETIYKGVGDTFSPEAIETINKARTEPRENEFLNITVLTKVKGPDGVNRLKAGNYLLK